jgi:hypothetical protein
MMTKPRSFSLVRRTSVAVAVILCVVYVPAVSAQSMEDKVQKLTQEVTELSALILELRAEMTKSREEVRDLRLELQKTRNTFVVADAAGATSAQGSPPLGQATPQDQSLVTPDESGPGPEQRLTLLEENHRLLSDRLEEQYQTKVESASRYRTKLTGIVLLNAFKNDSRVENVELPGLALRPNATDTGGTFGMTALQSAVGFETYGPELGSGRVSAGLQMDFFGEAPSSAHSASWGSFRLRTATVRVDWARTSLVVGQDTPFVSPLSPTSVASLAYPAFFYSGNLWSWIPQARIDHRVRVGELSTLTIQGGIFDPVTRGSRQPAYGTRLAFSHGDADRPLTIGVGGFYGRQDRGLGHIADGWAGTADWLIPLGSRFEVSGEFFRGRALGNLGATQNRSVIFDGLETDPLSQMTGLNTIGGWAQLHFKASSTVEFNVAQGEDHPYRRDLLRFVPAGGSSTAISKNKTGMFNVIYRPRTDLLFSMEYRRLNTSRVSVGREIANHFNLGVGVLF